MEIEGLIRSRRRFFESRFYEEIGEAQPLEERTCKLTRHSLSKSMELMRHLIPMAGLALGSVVMRNCWPYDQPVRMGNGNWITGGQDKDGLPVVAISRGDDFTQWDSVLIPFHEKLAPSFAETTVWAEGSDVLAIHPRRCLCRLGIDQRGCGENVVEGHSKSKQWSYPYGYEHDGKLYFLCSIGKEECGLSVLPVSALGK